MRKATARFIFSGWPQSVGRGFCLSCAALLEVLRKRFTFGLKKKKRPHSILMKNLHWQLETNFFSSHLLSGKSEVLKIYGSSVRHIQSRILCCPGLLLNVVLNPDLCTWRSLLGAEPELRGFVTTVSYGRMWRFKINFPYLPSLKLPIYSFFFLALFPKHLQVPGSFLSWKAARRKDSKLSQCLHLELDSEP